MRHRWKVLLLCAVLLLGGCRTLRTVTEVVVVGAVVAAVVLGKVRFCNRYHPYYCDWVCSGCYYDPCRCR
ncbi:MAG: hypothetical protein O7C98_11085 [Planctomycetota bacterium]|nr:hypothetical protein [Planctomycetota bacterium]